MSAPATPAKRRRGRRPAGEDLRAEILAAARAEFSLRGYDAVTLRGIARAAGVDPRLVHHYFDGKQAMFVEAMDFPIRPDVVIGPILAAGPDVLGERVVRMFFTAWDGPEQRPRIVALLGAAATSPDAARMLREFIRRELLDRIVAAMDVTDSGLRATLAAAQMLGVAVVRYVVKAEPLASADVEDLVPLLAPTLQRYLVG
jgi:AcrR family transcriptional regulator